MALLNIDERNVIGKEGFVCSNRILSYFKDKNRELYKSYVESGT
ncbi:hypothetical protein [Clostridium estertheticum]|nr:hypothetical protein [Clostridium estertheticum]